MAKTLDKKLSFSEVWRIGLNSLRTDYIPTLKNAFLFCISLSLIQFALSYGLRLIQTHPIPEQEMMTHRIIEIFWGVVVSIFFSIAVPYGFYFSKGRLKGVSILSFIKKNLRLVTIETFRSIFVVLLYLLLLVVPGLVKVIQLLFVPFIVQIHKAYQSGKTDALEKSKELVRGSLVGVATFYFLFQIVILGVEIALPAQLQKWLVLEPSSLAYLSLEFTFVVLFGVIAELACAVALLKIFENLVILKEGQNELAF